MSFVLQPWQLLVFTMSAWMTKLQQELIAYVLTMRSIKSEALSRIIFFGERSLRRATISYLAHYHQERNHQGLSNRIIKPGDELGQCSGAV